MRRFRAAGGIGSAEVFLACGCESDMALNVRGFRAGAVLAGALLLLFVMMGQGRPKVDPVKARGVVSGEPLVQGGQGRIAVEIVVDKKYHIQSARPLDKFLIRTEVSLDPSPGVTAGAVKYPEGKIVPGPKAGGTPTEVSAYEGTVYLVMPLTVAADAAVGPRTLALSLTTQACDDKKCWPPTTRTVNVEVVIGAAGTAAEAKNAEVFAAADGQTFSTAATEPATSTAPATTTAETSRGSVAGDAYSGVKLMDDAQQLAAIKERKYRPFNEEEQPLWLIMLSALVGGAILNIMPCVLPVIPLKVMSLVQQAHGDRKLTVLHGLVFSAGVISLFVGLAAALKSGELFYGAQFQSTGFLVAMVFFVLALALSMLGVWTLNPPRAVFAADEKAPHTGYLGSFTNGLMATLLATPCSAPFLGGALAWGFAQPVLLTMFTLALVGVGMSLPYLVLAMFPQLLSRVPRAGRWSELLKQGLGIVMIGVALYLVTRIENVNYWMWVLMGCVVVALACWGWGQLPTYDMERTKIWTIRAASVAVGGGIGAILYLMAMRSPGVATQTQMAGQDGWRPFNVALLDAAMKEGRPVVVDWTASWCINCHALEAFVLKTEAVEAAFKNGNVLLLKADLSRDNPPATLLNRELGGESIPVLAIFSPGRANRPVVLRDSYSPSTVIEEVQKAVVR